MDKPEFTKLIIWQAAHDLTIRVYRVSEKFPSEEKFGLTSQIRRAAISVESCVAEGHGRYHYSDSIKFFIDARGSAQEVQTQMLIAVDLGYPGRKDMEVIIDDYTILIKQINSMINYKRNKKKDLTKQRGKTKL